MRADGSIATRRKRLIAGERFPGHLGAAGDRDRASPDQSVRRRDVRRALLALQATTAFRITPERPIRRRERSRAVLRRLALSVLEAGADRLCARGCGAGLGARRRELILHEASDISATPSASAALPRRILLRNLGVTATFADPAQFRSDPPAAARPVDGPAMSGIVCHGRRRKEKRCARHSGQWQVPRR